MSCAAASFSVQAIHTRVTCSRKNPVGTAFRKNALYEVSVRSGFIRETRVRPVNVSRKEVAQPPSVSRKEVAQPPSTDNNTTMRSPFLNGPKEESHLDSSLPGYKNWDPLRLADPASYSEDEPIMNQQWLSYAELMHGRWAMLGAAGVITPELLGRWGYIPSATAVPWYVSGGLFKEGGLYAAPFMSSEFTYWCDSPTLMWSMLVLMGFAEGRRYMDYKNPGCMSKQYFLGLEKVLGNETKQPKYPGGQFFNFFNLGAKPIEMDVYKNKEVNNGRLAMMAMLGFGAQAVVTSEGPVQNFVDVFVSTADVPTFASGLTPYEAAYYGTFTAIVVLAGGIVQSARMQQEQQPLARVTIPVPVSNSVSDELVNAPSSQWPAGESIAESKDVTNN